MNHKLTNKKILITGGAGFIGSNLVEFFLGDNEVTCLDNLSTGHMRNIDEFLSHPDFRFMEGDIRDQKTCMQAVEKCDLVFHHAALGSVPRSINDPVATNGSNIDGFLNILVASRDAGVKRVIYAGSSSTYGDSEELPKVEHRIGKPLSPYAITKYVNELYASIFTEIYGLETIGLRYFNVFGKKQDPAGAYAAVIPAWVKRLLVHEPPVINGDGSYSRDFTYIENVLQANERAALTGWDELQSLLVGYSEQNGLTKKADAIFNIACNGNTTLLELYHILRANLQKNDPVIGTIEPVFGPCRPGDIPHSNACIKKAQQVIEYAPAIDVRSGLGLACGWYFENL